MTKLYGHVVMCLCYFDIYKAFFYTWGDNVRLVHCHLVKDRFRVYRAHMNTVVGNVNRDLSETVKNLLLLLQIIMHVIAFSRS